MTVLKGISKLLAILLSFTIIVPCSLVRAVDRSSPSSRFGQGGLSDCPRTAKQARAAASAEAARLKKLYPYRSLPSLLPNFKIKYKHCPSAIRHAYYLALKQALEFRGK